MKKKVVCVYETRATAEVAAHELLDYGIPASRINLSKERRSTDREKPEAESSYLFKGVESSLERFFHSVIDSDEKEMAVNTYLNALRQGHCILSVDVQNDEQATKAATIMDNFKGIHFLDLLASYEHESRLQAAEASLDAQHPDWKECGEATRFQDSSVHIFKADFQANKTEPAGEHDVFANMDSSSFDK